MRSWRTRRRLVAFIVTLAVAANMPWGGTAATALAAEAGSGAAQTESAAVSEDEALTSEEAEETLDEESPGEEEEGVFAEDDETADDGTADDEDADDGAAADEDAGDGQTDEEAENDDREIAGETVNGEAEIAGETQTDGEDVSELPGEEETKEETVLEESIVTEAPSDIDLPDNDDLLMEYLNREMFGNPAPKLRARKTAGSRLSEFSQYVYGKVVSGAKEIADGDRDSSRFAINIAQFDPGMKREFTAEELGVDQLFKETETGGYALTKETGDALRDRIGFNAQSIMDAVMFDCPYEMYWYCKGYTNTEDIKVGFQHGLANLVKGEDEEGNQTVIIRDDSVITMYLPVVENYATNFVKGKCNTDLATDKTRAASQAAGKAKDIVEEAKDLSDVGKLVYYKDKICGLVSYNYDAMENADDYGDPWQIIYVFDDDSTTNVVCEGYSKAFQYLSELTEWDEDISVISVAGTMGGAGHMWNVVRMEDGNNYIADLTNSDDEPGSPAVGSDGSLFLCGTREPVKDETGGRQIGYYMKHSAGRSKYLYDESDTLTLFTAEQTTLCDHDYDYKKDFNADTVKVEGGTENRVYNGKAQTQTIVVHDGDELLAEGLDYAVIYTSNVNAGKAKVTIKGRGLYCGEVVRTFNIAQANNTLTAPRITRNYSTKKRTIAIGAKAAGGTLTYKSGNAKIKVDKKGNVTIPAKFAGAAKITITAGGGNYKTATKSIYVVVPTVTKLSPLKASGAGRITVTWKKNTLASGYQVRYGTTRPFLHPKTIVIPSGSTVSRRISGLKKGKKYYFRVRCYREVNGKKYYSAWSNWRSTTIRR